MSGNIKKLYKYSIKCDNQRQVKAALEADMFSTPEIFTEISPMLPVLYVTVKSPSARKLLRPFSEVLDMKQNTDVRM